MRGRSRCRPSSPFPDPAASRARCPLTRCAPDAIRPPRYRLSYLLQFAPRTEPFTHARVSPRCSSCVLFFIYLIRFFFLLFDMLNSSEYTDVAVSPILPADDFLLFHACF